MKELKHIQLFEAFFYGNHKKPPIHIGDTGTNPEISIKVSKIEHTKERQDRHGADHVITDEEIIGTVGAASDDIVEALIKDIIDIRQKIDDRPLKYVKAGQNTRFIIRDLKTQLHMVCEINPLPENYHSIEVIVITVMRKEGFKTLNNQLILEIPADRSAFPEDREFYEDDDNAVY